jgi:hypothetical protein
MGSTEVKSQGIMGWLNGTGAGGQSYQNLHQDGGWFRSDKDWQTATDFDAQLSSQLGQAFLAIRASAQDAAQALGVSSASIDNFITTFNIALTNDKAANEKAIADYFAGLSDTMAKMVMPAIDEFSKTGETVSATLQRLVSDFKATDLMAQMLGKTATDVFGDIGLSSAKARERLIDLAGGADVLNQQTASYAQNFLSEAERLAPVQKALDAAMASLGLSSITTRDQFKACIDSLDLTTQAGAEQFTSMMKLAGAFAQVHPAIDAIVTSARSAADVLSEKNGLQDQLAQLAMTPEAYAKSKIDPSNYDLYDQVQTGLADKSYQDQINEVLKARMSETELRALETAGMGESTRKLYDRLAALKEEDAENAKAKAAADALTQTNKGFQDQIDSILKGRMSEAEVRTLETAGMDKSTVALYDRLAALKAEDVATAKSAEIARERAGLERQLYQAQGNTAALRQMELAALNGVNRDLQLQLYAIEDKKAADEAAAAAMQVWAVAAQRAAEASEQLKTAWTGITTSLMDEVARIRGLLSGGGATSLAGAQSSFAIATAQARAGDQDAAKLLPGLSKTLLDLAEQNAVSMVELRRIQGMTAASLMEASGLAGAKFGVPGFANGGDFAGGVRLVGEVGPEVEFTGPSRIASYNALMSRLSAPAENSAALAAAVERLTAENAAMRKVMESHLYAIAKNTLNTADHLDAAISGETPISTKAI